MKANYDKATTTAVETGAGGMEANYDKATTTTDETITATGSPHADRVCRSISLTQAQICQQF